MIYGPPPQFNRIIVEESEKNTLIYYRWWHWTYLSHLTTGVIFLIASYTMLTSDGVPERRLFGIIMVLIMLPLSVLSVYVSLTGLLNQTRICIHDGKVNIGSQPIPWRRDRSQEITDIVKIYHTERFARWKFEPPRVYAIWALTTDRNTKKILSHTNSELEALYICEQLQRSLELTITPYLEILLDKLHEPEQKINPYFVETRKYSTTSDEMTRAVQYMLEHSKLIYRQNSTNLPVIFDILDQQLGSGEFYMLTQVTIRDHAVGTEVTVKQRPKPYIPGTFGHSLNVRRFFGKIESAQEFRQYQFYGNPSDNQFT